MKYFAIISVAFSIAITLSTNCVSAVYVSNAVASTGYGYGAPAASGVGSNLGTLLSGIVNDLISSILAYLQNLLLILIGANTPVSVPALLQGLAAPSLSLASLLQNVFVLVNTNANTVVSELPRLIQTLPIDVASLSSVLLAAIPAGTPSVPFGTLASLLLNYLQQLLFKYVVGLLGLISNIPLQ